MVNAYALYAGCLEFKYQISQILHSVANVYPYFSIYAIIAVLPWQYDAEMGTANWLHTLAEYGEFNEWFGDKIELMYRTRNVIPSLEFKTCMTIKS